jgi:pimeloyl-ACP methyl ester carboxylesterase
MAAGERTGFEVAGAGGVALRGWSEGDGPPIVLAHGITAHRDLVLHGSRHLPRAGYRLIAYDARAHGESDGGPEGSYGYPTLADDLESVCDAQIDPGEGRALLCGHSMGAHTVLALAIRDPERWAGLVLIGPVSEGQAPDESRLGFWDSLADGLARGGVDGWIEAYEAGGLDPDWRQTLLRIARERMERHRNPDALAQALREVPRSVPYPGLAALGTLELPVLVVASHDEADPGHPRSVAERVAEALPDSRLVGEGEGESPLAWQGGKLSREIAGFCAEPAVDKRLR